MCSFQIDFFRPKWDKNIGSQRKKETAFFNLSIFPRAGPLVRIKQALTRLKQEVQQMDVRIGVVCLVTFTHRSFIP